MSDSPFFNTSNDGVSKARVRELNKNFIEFLSY